MGSKEAVLATSSDVCAHRVVQYCTRTVGPFFLDTNPLHPPVLEYLLPIQVDP